MDNKLNETYIEDDLNESYFQSNDSAHLVMEGEYLDSSVELTDEAKDIQLEDWRAELQKTEDDICTLREVLMSKVRYAQDLKRKLGVTPLSEVKEDIRHGVQVIRGSDTYQKTTAVVKAAKDKTSTTFVTASSKFSEKFGNFRNSNAFKSFEEKMGTAYTSVKGRITGSKSFEVSQSQSSETIDINGIQSINETMESPTNGEGAGDLRH